MIVEVELELEDTSIDEAIVSEVFVEEGEDVEEGDALVEVIADDNTFEVKSPGRGSVVEVHVEEEEVVKVGDELVVIETEEELDLGEEDDEDEDEDEDEEI